LQTPHQILQQYFGHTEFRPGQLQIIESALSGADTLGILSTGAGKSVCYQIPALIKAGTCVVVSPLIALMKDQVYNLLRRNISAVAVYSGMSNFEVENIYKSFEKGVYKFLFISPERAKSNLFRDYYETTTLNYLVVDEAHCISEWGYDFRPPYLQIAELSTLQNNIPIIALTASATPEVQKDIVTKLAFKTSNTYVGSTARSNLSFSCISVENKITKAIDIIKKVAGCTIIYCKNRGTTQRISDALNGQGISSMAYHAGMEMASRNNIQDAWINNNIQVVCCTNAFGMGIDKPDVRLVIHYDAPDSLEAYYQEAGRAGRDGKKSFAIVLYVNTEFQDAPQKIIENYPEASTILKIYDDVCNYLNVPFDSFENNSVDFDLLSFCKASNNSIITTIKSLKILEQQEIIALNESVFMPAKVMCIGDKHQLQFIENTYPVLNKVLIAILRLYAGVHNASVSISETKIAQMAEIDVHSVKPILQDLHKLDIIIFTDAKDKPQLFFIKERLRTYDIHLNLDLIKILKQRYTIRLQAAYNYYLNNYNCRMQLMAAYFGETLNTPCNICNNCIGTHKTVLSAVQFETINNAIVTAIKIDNVSTVKILMQHLNKYKTNDINTVLHAMMDDNKILLNKNGILTLP
jgi:ATP-dependent DNA helicase RecQ